VSGVRNCRVFNHPDRFIEGWYWALPSAELPVGAVKPVRLLGRELAVYRGEDGRAVALDAYCPHMGAHLGEGRVDGNGLRCFFHDWKFDCSGTCVEVPRPDVSGKPPRASTKAWPTAEQYGMVWVWTGESPARELPYVPELKDVECDALLGNRFVKNCHPNVVLINAIDENHFNSVHNLPVDLNMHTVAINDSVQTFSNTTRVPDSSWLLRTIGRLYDGPLTYSMCYHFGATGTVTVGPDLMHFHIMFALRLIDGGKTEGRTILITQKRPGVRGRAFNRVALAATKLVGDYFAKGDTQVFQTMKFDFQTPTKADHAIIDFVQHVDKQRALRFGSWAPLDSSGDERSEHGEGAARISLEVARA
jgi:phenylpropionate dioxygenase-like ring-hydroxylating dioxygenase large terminal subunit